MSGSSAEEPSLITYAVADLERGEIVEVLDGADSSPQLEGLAAAAPELCNREPSPSGLMLGRNLDLEPERFDTVMLVSAASIFVIHRVSEGSPLVLLGVSSQEQSVGWVLDGLRKRARELARATHG